jgi:hypothetical protein
VGTAIGGSSGGGGETGAGGAIGGMTVDTGGAIGGFTFDTGALGGAIGGFTFSTSVPLGGAIGGFTFDTSPLGGVTGGFTFDTGGALGGAIGGFTFATGGALGGATGGNTIITGGTTVVANNMIKNGDFSMGKTYWDLTWQEGDVASSSYTGGEYCVYNMSSYYYLSFSLGYPPTPTDAFVIEAGASYTLSYRVSGSGSIEAKIGGAVPPYTALTSFMDSVFSPSSYVTKSHVITSTTGLTQAGLVFNGTLYYSDSVCFDDVVLVKN